MRNRSQPLNVVLLIVAGAFSGCLAGGDPVHKVAAPGSDEPISTVIVEPEPGVKIAENRGALRGHVRNEANLSVAGAHVSLLNTDHFGEADKNGEFSFLNISAGDYEVFVQAEGYQSLTETATVTNGNVTTLLLFLAPPLDAEASGRFHVHDFWGDRTEVTIMDSPVDLGSVRANGGASYSLQASTVIANGNSSDRFKFWLQGNGQDPAIIFPGTRELVVTFSWTNSQSTFTKLGLAYNHSSGASTAKPIYLPLQASGTAWRIPLNGGMADDGHRSFSKWKFWVHTGPAVTSSPTGREVGVVTGPIRVKMVLLRGDVAPEPPHPDFWEGKRELRTMERQLFDSPNVISYTSGNRESGSYALALGTKLVPPGTTRIQVDFYWHYTNANAGAVFPNGSAADREYVVTWLTADQHPAYTTLSQYRRAEPVYQNVAGHHKSYMIQLKPEETDRFYDERSGWAFLPSVKGKENDPEFEETRGRQYFLTVTCFRDDP